jgi:uroporphyrinogen-III synthase
MTAILVTRPAGATDSLVAELESRGYRVSAVPTMSTRTLAVEWPDLKQMDWIVVTSAAGVDSLPDTPAGPRWAAVGESTARALRAKGAKTVFVPSEANGTALAEEIPDPAGARLLLVRASLADPDLPAGLRRRGARVQEITAYETVEGPAESAGDLRRALEQPDLGGVVFASGSAVRGFVKLGGPTSLRAVTIGPRTSAVARDAGLTVVAEAEGPSVRHLADAVARGVPIEAAHSEVKRNA